MKRRLFATVIISLVLFSAATVLGQTYSDGAAVYNCLCASKGGCSGGGVVGSQQTYVPFDTVKSAYITTAADQAKLSSQGWVVDSNTAWLCYRPGIL